MLYKPADVQRLAQERIAAEDETGVSSSPSNGKYEPSLAAADQKLAVVQHVSSQAKGR